MSEESFRGCVIAGAGRLVLERARIPKAMKEEQRSVKTFFTALGTWALCVCVSAAATWSVSETFGLHFNAATVVFLSSAAVATAYVVRALKKA